MTDAAAERVFLAIREPSMVLVARLPELSDVEHWALPSGGAHGLDVDHRRGRLYVACDDGALVELDTSSGTVTNQWPIAGVPDVTFFNPATGLVHVAIGEPGLVQSIDPRTGDSTQTKDGRGGSYDGVRRRPTGCTCFHRRIAERWLRGCLAQRFWLRRHIHGQRALQQCRSSTR